MVVGSGVGCGRAGGPWAAHRVALLSVWFGVNSYGTDAKGHEWTARSYDLGGATYTTITGPDGNKRRCSSYMLGSTRYTRCD